ncbi:MAG: 3-deoxy-7-phosphoheptulonate synthase [Candidatus Aureabacteria bacterium]|nr:3-deoxy-7-phosphoheptulonate synthase [Candidatus Auribacterota bacterium]
MIIVMNPDATKKQTEHIIKRIKELRCTPKLLHGVEREVIAVIGPEDQLRLLPLEVFPGVEKVMPVLKPYKLVSRQAKPEDTIVRVGKVSIGGGKTFNVMAGPCSIEGLDMMENIWQEIRETGIHIMRGGAYKPRTSPYSFQGMGLEGLEIIRKIKKKFGLSFVTEVMDTKEVELIEKYADILQIGARNVQNFNLLKEVGKSKKPVMLKRGMSTTIKEFLMSAEYILSNGNPNVILCERGIRTFETITRFTLDISAVPLIKKESHLPVFIDPSHGGGRRDLVEPLSTAALAIGADGIIVEVHNDPEKAISDGEQSLKPHKFIEMMKKLQLLADFLGKEIC